MFRSAPHTDCSEESNTAEEGEEDVTVVIGGTTDDLGGQRSNRKTEYVEVQSGPPPRTGCGIAGRRRMIGACVVLLLCFLLLSGFRVLCVRSSSLAEERDGDLQTEILRRQEILASIDAHARLGWRYFNSSVYYTSTERKNWTESRRDCRDREADLVILSSGEEQDFISKQILNRRVWIGLTDQDSEGDWKWVDGTALNTQYWLQNEPDNYGNNEHCAEIFGSEGRNSWTDVPCSDKEHWICEKKFVLSSGP